MVIDIQSIHDSFLRVYSPASPEDIYSLADLCFGYSESDVTAIVACAMHYIKHEGEELSEENLDMMTMFMVGFFFSEYLKRQSDAS